ncbi:hypothetical protein J0H58_38980 [bacterium]|nr:hypothetical protein [bacterium]
MWTGLTLFVAAAVGGGNQPPAQPVNIQKDIYPFLRRHCVSCHNDTSPGALRSLTGYQDETAIRRDPGGWAEVVRLVESRAMPPANSPRPPAPDRDRFLQYARELRTVGK